MPDLYDCAYPERYPQHFIPGRCAACTNCWLGVQSRRCPCGGPYDAGLNVDASAFIPRTINRRPP